MEFQWDEHKNTANFQKHGVWADELAREFFDPEHSAKEDRFIRIGHSTGNRLLMVVFCEREDGDVVRIVSARQATAKETKEYEEGI